MIAYFTMDIGVERKIPTYSGGLGILAGDTLRTAADLSLPFVGVTLIYHKGFFKQKVNKDGAQEELLDEWEPGRMMELLPKRVSVEIGDDRVIIGAWKYNIEGKSGFKIPILFLDSDFSDNSSPMRDISQYLYGRDHKYRLMQEIMLGIGGVRILKEMGFNNLLYHMNESHSALIIKELLKETDIENIRKRCLFTIHTPIPAGHDKFPPDLAEGLINDWKGGLDMTGFALYGAGYVNGVSKRHMEVSRQMFKRDDIRGITNGVHSVTWTSPEFAVLYDRYIEGWREDPSLLRRIKLIPDELVWSSHMTAKKRLFEFIKEDLNIDNFTIGFARRFIGYKRADLIFSNLERLKSLGKIQLIFSGKAHPRDEEGKNIMKRVVNIARELKGNTKITFIEDYNIDIAKLLTQGVDLWLNNPLPPFEACGTSGMKAAHNGIPSLSTLDGWWVEGCKEGVTGWSLEDDGKDIYDKLGNVIIPLFYNDRGRWIEIMKNAIEMNASYFNTHRMLLEYNKIYEEMENKNTD